MTLRILYFAALRETLGVGSEQVAVPADVTTVSAVRVWLRQRGGVWAEAFAEGRNVRAALDQRMAGLDEPVKEGAELAFFPPVTGG